ncbi:MAG: DNA recombination protein RmuC [Clostridia bacterium]|nr:DNA recombination protein RmuC [Clostridia bacterium]
MEWTTITLLALGAVNAGLLIAAVVLLAKPRDKRTRKDIARGVALMKEALGEELGAVRKELTSSQSDLRQEVTAGVSNLGNMLTEQQRAAAAQQEERLRSFEQQNIRSLELVRQMTEHRLTKLQEDNNKRLDEIHGIVDEKLQKTLEERMDRSFRLVSERLEQVYKGLGEMQTLANGVGDLKKVLSNVKTRGILGEIQLGAILREVLSPAQYLENAVTKRDATERVEFAIKLPTEDGGTVLLPVDSKFPGDTYRALLDARDTCDKDAIQKAGEEFERRLRREAKDIREKYVDPPQTTEFGVMFLPFEGLYAEAVNRGMVEELQNTYRISIAGPSTMAALLNTLQMGFRTVALQKRSGEVWKVLGAVRTEFSNFEDVLRTSQRQISQVSENLDKLVGVRTRRILKTLNSVEELEPDSAEQLLVGADDE